MVNIDELKAAAKQALGNSYSPYSRFQVAAALADDQGRIFTGVNVENASFGLTMCAERCAIGTAIGRGAKSLTAIVIYTPTPTPTPPCGACRQVIHEFSNSTRVVSCCDSEAEIDQTISQLLPGSFSL